MYVRLWRTGQIDEGMDRMGTKPDEVTEDQPTDEETGSLLDSLTDEEDGQEDQQEEESQDSGVDVDGIVAQIEQRLADRFDAVADRRVNAILKELRKQQPKKEEPVPTATEQSVDVRAARLTFKEYVSDEVQFIGAEERKFAMDFGAALIGAKAAVSDDEEVLGREVADEVAAKVREMRSYYEKRTLDALRRRGALKQQEGQPPKGPSSVGGSSEFAKGAALAEQMFTKS